MNDDELPPWQSLPPDVRDEVNERMHRRYGAEDEQGMERARQELRYLSAFRLINYYGLKKAMRKGREYPAFGPDPKSWTVAYKCCVDVIIAQAEDPLAVERSKFVVQAVREALAKRRAK